MKKVQPILALLCILIACPALAGPSSKVLDDYQKGISPIWQEKSFKGITHYTVDRADKQTCIRAESNGTASGLFYEMEIDPRQFPILEWTWRIDNIIEKGNARTKEGDDYAARIYVAFKSFFFWNTKVLNYVWANKLPKGAAVPNAFSDNFMMIAVESGPAQVGSWQTVRRNIAQDYRRYFGEEPPRIGAVAIMTDTDNTGERATACYGPLIFRSAVPAP